MATNQFMTHIVSTFREKCSKDKNRRYLFMDKKNGTRIFYLMNSQYCNYGSISVYSDDTGLSLYFAKKGTASLVNYDDSCRWRYENFDRVIHFLESSIKSAYRYMEQKDDPECMLCAHACCCDCDSLEEKVEAYANLMEDKKACTV